MSKKQDILIKNTKEIDLKEYYSVIKKRFWIIILMTIISTLAGYFYQNMSNNNVPIYQSSTRMFVTADDESMKDLMVMIKDPTIMEKVKDELQISKSPEKIAEQIEVSKIDDSRVLRISVIDTDPKMAADIANETAHAFKSEIKKILNYINTDTEIQLLSPAKENDDPINETNNWIIKVMIVMGIVLGFGLVFLLDSLDETIKRNYEVEDVLSVPVIGVVSNMNMKKLKVRGETVDI